MANQVRKWSICLTISIQIPYDQYFWLFQFSFTFGMRRLWWTVVICWRRIFAYTWTILASMSYDLLFGRFFLRMVSSSGRALFRRSDYFFARVTIIRQYPWHTVEQRVRCRYTTTRFVRVVPDHLTIMRSSHCNRPQRNSVISRSLPSLLRTIPFS